METSITYGESETYKKYIAGLIVLENLAKNTTKPVQKSVSASKKLEDAKALQTLASLVADNSEYFMDYFRKPVSIHFLTLPYC